MFNDEITSKITKIIPNIQRMLEVVLVVYVVGVDLYQGISSGTFYGFVIWAIIGLTHLLILIALNIGLRIWERSTDWFVNTLNTYPKIRLWLIFPFLVISPILIMVSFPYWDLEFTFQFMAIIYFVLILPSALLSLMRDDVKKDRTTLADIISRELIAQNPQAAVAHAFTLFEDHLRQRIGGDSGLYGEGLINAAYGGNNSRLVYQVNGHDQTVHLRNLAAGAYSILRNPRHHRVIDDDEQTVQAAISLAELLIRFVDASGDRA